jgi:lipopolysaccharide transport protein LptA
MMKIMRCSLLFLIFFLGTVLPATVFSENDSDTALQVTNLGKIIIESDSFNWKTKEKTIVFSENVTARREGLTIECDKIRVYYTVSENGDVNYDRAQATGNVKITRDDGLSGTAEKAVYDINEETVVMTGQPNFKKGKSSWKGSSLTYDVKDESISGSDVEFVLDQEEQEGILTGGE